MALSNELISQFVKITNDKKEPSKESTAYGKIVVKDGKEYVQLDGSDLLTPISTTTVVKDEDRVMVTIKNHTAIVTGDLTNPSASNKDVTEIGDKISEVEILMADKVVTQDLEAINAYIENIKGVTAKYEELSAITAEIETLQAKYANMEHITATDAEILNAEIDSLKGKFAEFTNVSTQDLEAINAELTNLQAYNASFNYVSADKLDVIDANIKRLNTDKLDAETAKITYATIDFANINEAAVEKLFSDSGIIKDLVMSDGKVTGELVGVTIKGDIIEGNTVKADKLVILGTDGLYYKLNVDALGETTASSDEKYQNGLDGSVIVAESITAEKIAVDDLVAFGATIGGFHINNHAIYSGVKSSMSNTTPGMHMTDDGQINIGDQNNFFKYYIDGNGKYRLEIQADTLKLGSGGTTIEQYIKDVESEKLVTIKEIEGTELVIPDGKKVIDFRVDGKSTQDTRSGIQKFKYQGLATPHTNTDFWAINASTLDTFMTPLENGWTKFKATNTGTGDQIYNFIMNRTAFDIKPNTEYTMVLEFRNIVENATSGYFNPIGDSSTVSYFTTVATLRMSLITEGMHKYTLTSKSDISRSIINSYMFLPAGESCEFECRMSILEGNYTLIDYEYEAYGAMPSPDYPSEMESVGYENLLDLSKWEIKNAKLNNDKTLTSNINNGYYMIISTNSLNDFLMDNMGKCISLSVKSNGPERELSIIIFGTRTNGGTYYERNTSGNAVSMLIPTDFTNITSIELRLNRGYPAFTDTTTVFSDIMLNLGVSPKSYVPYGKYGVEIINKSKNMINVVKENRTSNGLDFTYNDDGSITINGTSTAHVYQNINITYTTDKINNNYFTLEQGVTYTSYLRKSLNSAPIKMYVRTSSQNEVLLSNPAGRTTTTQTYTGKTDFEGYAYFDISTGQTFDNVTVYPMIVKGSYTLDTIGKFEKYFDPSSISFVLDKPLRSLPNGVKDTAYIQNGKLTVERKVGHIVLNGTETWSYDAQGSAGDSTVYGAKTQINDYAGNDKFTTDDKNINLQSDLFQITHTYTKPVEGMNGGWGNYIYVKLFATRLSEASITAVKAFFAENNTEIIYELVSPTIEEIEPIDVIPMHEESTDIYYISDDLEPNMYCKYYTIYAGIDGSDGKDGANGKDGADGKDGSDGKSAYELWLEEGNVGTVEDFLNSNSISNISDRATTLYIDDGVKVIDFRVEGNSYQETRSDKNKFNVADINSPESLISVEDSSFYINNCWGFSMMQPKYINKYFKPNTSYIATAKVTVISKPTTMSSFNHSVILMLYDGTNSASMLYTNNKIDLAVNESVELSCQFTTPSDLTNFRMLAYSFHGNNDGSTTYAGSGQLKVEKLMIREHIGTNDTFEAYGASPSPDYPSEIESVGYENLWNNDAATTNSTVLEKTKTGFKYVRDSETGGKYLACVVNLKANQSYTFSIAEQYQDIVLYFYSGSVYGTNLRSGYNDITYTPTTDMTVYAAVTIGSTVSNVEVSDIRITNTTSRHGYCPHGKYGIDVIRSGKNYYPNSGEYKEMGYASGTLDTENTLNGYSSISTISAWAGPYLNLKKLLASTDLKVGDTVTYSIYFKTNFTPNRAMIFSAYRFTSASKNASFSIPAADVTPGKWIRIKTTFTLTEYSLTSANARLESDYYDYNDQYYFGNNRANKIYFACPQLEKGSTMTDWEAPFIQTSTFILDQPLRRYNDEIKDVAYVNHGKLYVDRKIGNMVLNGSEMWTMNQETTDYISCYEYRQPYMDMAVGSKSNYFGDMKKWLDVISDSSEVLWRHENSSVGIRLLKSRLETPNVSGVIKWLSTHNVSIDYILPSPTTEYIGEIDIPMYKDTMNIYYVNDDLESYIQCEYYTNFAERVADLDKIVKDVEASITIESGKIIQKVSEDYVKIGDFNQYTDVTAKTEMETTSKGVFIDLNEKHNEKRFGDIEYDIENVNKKLNKNFSFTQDGLTIGSGDSAVKLIVDNKNGIIFERKDGYQLGYWDGNNFYAGNIVIRVDERAQFGNYAYIPKSDGSLMFTRVK